MDFKSLISKITSMEEQPKIPAAPELPKAVQLNEDAELRVLAGTSSYIAEAKKKAEEKKEEKVDEASEKQQSSWTDKSGKQHPATKVKGDRYGSNAPEAKDDEVEQPKKKSAKKESIDQEQFKAKFTKMVEAKKSEKTNDKKKSKKMDEAAKPDFLDMDKDGDKKEPMKKAVADKKKGGKPQKGVNPFAKKNESAKQSKKVVAESVEQKLSFRDMVKLVQESGGQQAIDPVDQELFAWATRVAQNKFVNEGVKAELYAGMVYERMGGTFELYDVLSETKK